MRRIVILGIATAAIAIGCGDIKLVADPSKEVPAPVGASEAEALIASSYGTPAVAMNYLEIHWYGGAALTCNDGGFIASDGHTCVGGEHQDGVIIVADDGRKISATKYLAHEMLHFHLQQVSGDPDEHHSGSAWGVDWDRSRGMLDVANDAVAAAGL